MRVVYHRAAFLAALRTENKCNLTGLEFLLESDFFGYISIYLASFSLVKLALRPLKCFNCLIRQINTNMRTF